MNVIQIISEALTDRGFDGLYSSGGGCACEIGDLAPCGDIMGTCMAGYRYWCEDADCEFTAEAGRHWHMRAVK